jgi:hypothetical protein
MKAQEKRLEKENNEITQKALADDWKI